MDPSGNALPARRPKVVVRDLDFYYGADQVLHRVSLPLYDTAVTAIIGPSGCGKSTLLRAINRIYALYPDQRATGQVMIDGKNILDTDTDLDDLRAHVGMVFQRPTPFPMSVYENIAFVLRLARAASHADMKDKVEKVLRQAALWDEVKDILHQSALDLSGGQQQRLCIARAIAARPEVLLLDEPCSALDPLSTSKIEDLMDDLKRDRCIAIVTHNIEQAARVSDFAAFMYLGKLVEFGPTEQMFTRPADPRTQEFVTGRFG
ncbi:MAG TPA: phosphate ABC transporter ATP-binding protein PstB [Dongiaceae bacterium]|nr:phosphate ABC transporter ATP-binding protein PstB [Dongiaceae bacterium]